MRLRLAVLSSLLLAGVLAGCGLGGHPPAATQCPEVLPDDNDTELTADPTDPPCTLVGNVVSGGNDYFAISPSAGGSVSISCSTSSSEIRVFVQEVGGGANAIDCGSSGIVVEDLTAGTYVVRVATVSGTVLPYAIDLAVT